MKDTDEHEMDGVPKVAKPADTGLRINLFLFNNIYFLKINKWQI